MSVNTVTSLPPAAPSGDSGGTSVGRSFTASRAARELGVKRAELELAVQLGHVRTVPDPGGGGRRIHLAEIERLRAQEGFPDSLRRRVRTVGTQEAAAVLGVPTGRFTRLARLGLVTPVRFYLNRYRVVVWLYLAEELRQFIDREDVARLLAGRMPRTMRDQLEAGVDLRPRNWRQRHLGFLLRQTTDPWERAAVVASLLDPGQVAALVTDPYERAHLDRLRPEHPAQAASESPAARLVTRIITAQDPDEIGWLRSDLARSVGEAREHGPAPRPAQPLHAFDHSSERPGLLEQPERDAGAHPVVPRHHTVRPTPRGAALRERIVSARLRTRRPTGRQDSRTPARVPRWRALLTRLRPGREPRARQAGELQGAEQPSWTTGTSSRPSRS